MLFWLLLAASDFSIQRQSAPRYLKPVICMLCGPVHMHVTFKSTNAHPCGEVDCLSAACIGATCIACWSKRCHLAPCTSATP